MQDLIENSVQGNREVGEYFLAGVWKSRRIRNKRDKRRRLLCIGKEEIKDMVVACSETRNRERTFEVKICWL